MTHGSQIQKQHTSFAWPRTQRGAVYYKSSCACSWCKSLYNNTCCSQYAFIMFLQRLLCIFFLSSLCNTLCSRIKAKATKPLNWRMRFLLLICACSHACVCVSVCVQQERMFLSVSNYIFTVIFVGEMMIKVTITVNIFWISTLLQSHFLDSKEAIFVAGGDQNGFHSHFTP